MARIACLLPREDMVSQAWNILHDHAVDWSGYALTIEYGPSPHAIEWAQKIHRQEAADIIMARGLQASHIKQNTTIPLVEVRLTGQEMGLLISRAKATLNIARPLISVVGYANQFCNMEHFSEIFDVNLRFDFAESDCAMPKEELRLCARRAVEGGANLIIGGDTAREVAAAAGIPSLFIASTGDSFLEAFRTARSMAYAIDIEKNNTAQMKTLLDNSFGIIVHMDTNGCITLTNHVVETLLGWSAQQMLGQPIDQAISGISACLVRSVLTEGAEVFSQYVSIGKVSMVANLVPVRVGDSITGAILAAQEVDFLEEMGTVARRHQYKLDRIAKTRFEEIEDPSRVMRRAVETARLYAKSEDPVLIVSEHGAGQERFAQAIHNESARKEGPFVSINCAETDAQAQLLLLFGAPDGGKENAGMLAAAHGGTVLLEHIHGLSPVCQHRLLGLLKDGVLLGGNLQRCYADIRVIATCGDNLPLLADSGEFFSELYYTLNALLLNLEPLRKRPEDILHWSNYYLRGYGERYKRYLSLTDGGKKQLLAYGWHGNLPQLRAFFQRLVLTAPRRTVDENDIHHLFARMYPVLIAPSVSGRLEKGVFRNDESALLCRLLQQHKGNRSLVAAELGISTTTLWRKIKKYDINVAALAGKHDEATAD